VTAVKFSSALMCDPSSMSVTHKPLGYLILPVLIRAGIRQVTIDENVLNITDKRYDKMEWRSLLQELVELSSKPFEII
ncbi:hypothetical protein PFISCL1PPCAC_21651, partial [Pristionchus fissidentatus]